MRKRPYLWALLALLLPLAAHAQQTLTVADSTATNNYLPLSFGRSGWQTEMVYPASMLTDMVGASITGVTFYTSDTSNVTFSGTTTVRIGEVASHTPYTSRGDMHLSDADAASFAGIVTITAGQAAIVFDEPYTYGGDDLVINIFNPASTTGSSFVGITHTAQNSPIVEAIAKYAAEKGGVHINFVSGYIKELYEQLDEYVLDMAVVEGSNEDPSFNSVLLDTDTLLVAMSPRNHLASKATLTLDDLRKEKLILRSKGSATRSLFEASLESHESHIKEFDVLVESESLNVIKDLVMKDSGVSILPASSCVSEVKKGKLVLLPIIGLPMTRQVNIVVRKSFKRMDILDGIVSSYRKMMGEAI